jgi:hypothetical protein
MMILTFNGFQSEQSLSVLKATEFLIGILGRWGERLGNWGEQPARRDLE